MNCSQRHSERSQQRRIGLWTKRRINLGQAFVIGGYIPSNLSVDHMVIGNHLKTAKCPFMNLPELADGRWGQGLTAEKMKKKVGTVG